MASKSICNPSKYKKWSNKKNKKVEAGSQDQSNLLSNSVNKLRVLCMKILMPLLSLSKGHQSFTIYKWTLSWTSLNSRLKTANLPHKKMGFDRSFPISKLTLISGRAGTGSISVSKIIKWSYLRPIRRLLKRGSQLSCKSYRKRFNSSRLSSISA